MIFSIYLVKTSKLYCDDKKNPRNVLYKRKNSNVWLNVCVPKRRRRPKNSSCRQNVKKNLHFISYIYNENRGTE